MGDGMDGETAETFAQSQPPPQPPQDEAAFMSIDEAVRASSLTRSEVNRYIGSGEFASARYKNRTLVSKASIVAYKARQAELDAMKPPPVLAAIPVVEPPFPDIKEFPFSRVTCVPSHRDARLIVLSDTLPADGSRPATVLMKIYPIVAWTIDLALAIPIAAPVLPSPLIESGPVLLDCVGCNMATLDGRLCQSLDAEEEAQLLILQDRWDAKHGGPGNGSNGSGGR